MSNKYKKGDLVYIKTSLALDGMFSHLIDKVGVIEICHDDKHKDSTTRNVDHHYHVRFNNGEHWLYLKEDVRRPTQDEHDRYYLYKFAYAK